MEYQDTLHLTGVTAISGFDGIASGYGYNLRSVRDTLAKQGKEIEKLSRQVERLRQPSILNIVLPAFQQRRLEKVLENYEEKFMSWKSFLGRLTRKSRGMMANRCIRAVFWIRSRRISATDITM